jgi:hypothetical protein
MKISFSELKDIHQFCADNGIDWKEVASNMADDSQDFEVDNYRFIAENDIDAIQCEEMKNDPYILGCFNAWFIADNSSLSLAIVEALQKGEQYDAIGEHLIDNNCVGDMQKAYAGADGYGHHFSHYDGETLEDLLHLGYYAFRVN